MTFWGASEVYIAAVLRAAEKGKFHPPLEAENG